jgi:hypothetical protein
MVRGQKALPPAWKNNSVPNSFIHREQKNWEGIGVKD